MTVLSGHAARITLAMAAVASLAAGCAKESTSVLVAIGADTTVPPILILRTTIARTDDPTVQSSTSRSSPYASDAADRPGPFLFPFALPLTVDPVFAGDVTITVDGIDWDDTTVVIASASTTTTIVAQKQTTAVVTLEPIRGGGGDGGTD